MSDIDEMMCDAFDEQDETEQKYLEAYNLERVKTGEVIISDQDAPFVAPPAPKEKKKRAPRKRKDPSVVSAEGSKKLARIHKTHARLSNKNAHEIANSAFELYGNSTLTETRDEAMKAEAACREELRRIRALIREAGPVANGLAENGKKLKPVDQNLATESASTIAMFKGELTRMEESFSKLADSFGKNSARCFVAVRSSGHSAPNNALIASSDNKTLAKLTLTDEQRLQLGDEHQHPRIAMMVGSTESSAVGVSTRPGRLSIQGQPGSDYVAFSVARDQFVPTNKAAHRSSQRTAANNRVEVRKARAEKSMRMQLMYEEELLRATLNSATNPLAIEAPSFSHKQIGQ